MKKILLATLSSVAALPAMAEEACFVKGGIPAPCPVPEISAVEGVAAMAAVAAVLLLVWERKRRAA